MAFLFANSSVIQNKNAWFNKTTSNKSFIDNNKKGRFVQTKAKVAQTHGLWTHHKRIQPIRGWYFLRHQPKMWTICCQMKTWQVFPKTDKRGLWKALNKHAPAFKWIPRGFNTHFFPRRKNISKLLAYHVNWS